MWNYLSLTRHEDGCKFIRRDGPGFETKAGCCWEVLCKIMDACDGLEDRTALMITYTQWWSALYRNFLTVSEAGVTFVMYEFTEEAGREEAAMGALRAMFDEMEFKFDFRRIQAADVH